VHFICFVVSFSFLLSCSHCTFFKKKIKNKKLQKKKMLKGDLSHIHFTQVSQFPHVSHYVMLCTIFA
jgi:hypothetical protein